jgi:hypothetical protein
MVGSPDTTKLWGDGLPVHPHSTTQEGGAKIPARRPGNGNSDVSAAETRP